MTSYVELCELAEADDILMIDAPLQKCPSMAINDCGDCTVIIDHDQIAGVADLLTVLAHELGHCETMSFYTEHSLELRERMEYRANKKTRPEGRDGYSNEKRKYRDMAAC